MYFRIFSKSRKLLVDWIICELIFVVKGIVYIDCLRFRFFELIILVRGNGIIWIVCIT